MWCQVKTVVIEVDAFCCSNEPCPRIIYVSLYLAMFNAILSPCTQCCTSIMIMSELYPVSRLIPDSGILFRYHSTCYPMKVPSFRAVHSRYSLVTVLLVLTVHCFSSHTMLTDIKHCTFACPLFISSLEVQGIMQHRFLRNFSLEEKILHSNNSTVVSWWVVESCKMTIIVLHRVSKLNRQKRCEILTE